jgi:hypothetical protein
VWKQACVGNPSVRTLDSDDGGGVCSNNHLKNEQACRYE